MARRALVTGITGQDGSYLAELLLDKGYEVHGLVRDPAAATAGHLAGFAPRLVLHRGDLTDGDSLRAAVGGAEPEEIYNLAAVSHVPASWGEAAASAEVNALGPVRLLEAVLASGSAARIFQASSSEAFPGCGGARQDEGTGLRPRSPYGAAKAYAQMVVADFRRRHDHFACSGIFFNHESPRRPPRFVSRRISRGVAAIKLGLAEELPLGNLDARRDWGYAPEYIEAAWAMLQAPEPEDLVIGSGRAHSVAALAALAFAAVGLEAEPYLRRDAAAARAGDREYALADPARARRRLGWSARTELPELVAAMVAADLERLAAEST